MSKQDEIMEILKDSVDTITHPPDSECPYAVVTKQVDYKYAAKKIEALFSKSNAACFKKGQVSVRRRNKSGCCCTFDENDNEIIQVCGAHQDWHDGLNEEGKVYYVIQRWNSSFWVDRVLPWTKIKTAKKRVSELSEDYPKNKYRLIKRTTIDEVIE